MTLVKQTLISLSTMVVTLMASVAMSATSVSTAAGVTPAAAVQATAVAPTATPAPVTAPVVSPVADTNAADKAEKPHDDKAVAKTETGVPVARVVWVKGDLIVERPDKSQRKVTKDGIIYLHDTLSTDDKSQAQIIFSDNGLMTFRTGTKFYIEDYQFDPKKKVNKGESAGTFVMNLIQGGFRTVTGLISKSNPKDYKVKTPVATIGVRGTQFTVLYVPPSISEKVKESVKQAAGNLVVEIEKGAICLTDSAGLTSCLDLSKRYAEFVGGVKEVKFYSEKPATLKTEKLPINNVKFKQFTLGDTKIPSPAKGLTPSTTPGGGSGSTGGTNTNKNSDTTDVLPASGSGGSSGGSGGSSGGSSGGGFCISSI